MTDEEFAELRGEHPDLIFEMSAEGEPIVRPPNYTLTSDGIAKFNDSSITGRKLMGAVL